MTALLAEAHLCGLSRGAERIANLGPGGPGDPRLTDGDALQFGGLGTGESGATDARYGGWVVLDSAADGDAEQEIGGAGVHVHTSRMLDVPTTVKGS